MHRARKRFGQHFLHDRAIIQRIVVAIDPRTDDAMVEIGPGLGAITVPLLGKLRRLHAIEIDRDAIRHLQGLAGGAALHIHEADVLTFDLRELRDDERKLRIVGNLPYNISTPLLFRLIEQRDTVLDMHFMLQKEVVERMAAGPDTEHYGRLSVMLAPWVRVTPLFEIGPGAFRPPPRVTSAFARLTPHTPPFIIDDQRVFSSVVAAAFSQRRKTLRNALKSLLSEHDIAQAGIDPGLRAEVIAPAGFAALANRLASNRQRPTPAPHPDL
jgi:16S rRNA (adenine1518-N6/adenine1519-N6)-dimethyltransferase